jgi:hypothetical protein
LIKYHTPPKDCKDIENFIKISNISMRYVINKSVATKCHAPFKHYSFMTANIPPDQVKMRKILNTTSIRSITSPVVRFFSVILKITHLLYWFAPS